MSMAMPKVFRIQLRLLLHGCLFSVALADNEAFLRYLEDQAVLAHRGEGLSFSRQTPAVLAAWFDVPTLRSMSTSQLDACGAILSGQAPLLSRTLRCKSSQDGCLRPKFYDDPFETWQNNIESYLLEEAELAKKQAASLMRHVWVNYEQFAWGRDELKPISGLGDDSWGGLGMTLVDSLDTLWLMGMHQEFDRAVDWVSGNLNFDVDLNVNFFETSIRQLGGLLAAYGLSKRRSLLLKAIDLGDRLMLAFEQEVPGEEAQAVAKAVTTQAASVLENLLRHIGIPAGEAPSAETLLAVKETIQQPRLAKDLLPASDINLGTGQRQNLGNFISLAEAYIPLEFKTLSLYTGNCSYARGQEQVLRIVNASQNLEATGVAPILLTQTGQTFKSADNRISLGSRGDSFYEYLLKDSIFSDAGPSSMERRLWMSFLQGVAPLLVMATPAEARRQARKATWVRKFKRKALRKFNQTSTSTSTAADAAPDAGEEILPDTASVEGGGGSNNNNKEEEEEDKNTNNKNNNNNNNNKNNKNKSKRKDKKAKTAPPESPDRGGAGRLGGWYEEHADVPTWIMLQEIGNNQQRINKMDHLVCFLPGAIALDVRREAVLRLGLPELKVGMQVAVADDIALLESATRRAGLQPDKNNLRIALLGATVQVLKVDLTDATVLVQGRKRKAWMPAEALELPGKAEKLADPEHSWIVNSSYPMEEFLSSKLAVAHALTETCVQMYFRTSSDLAPEITRFDPSGLVDDLGSMHHILRPETVESLFIMWRSTHSKIYRNWAQRLLSAFARQKTEFGYASLFNVNKPDEWRDDMPSFFMAETIKYLYLIFSEDEVLDLNRFVLGTEAHPFPTVLESGLPWPCYAEGDPTVFESNRDRVDSSLGFCDGELTQLRGRYADLKQRLQSQGGESQLRQLRPQTPEKQPLEVEVPDPPWSEASLRAALQGLPEEQKSLLRSVLDDGREPRLESPTPPPPPPPTEPLPSSPQDKGSISCWDGRFTAELCCYPAPRGNPACWDPIFTYESCCR